MMQSQCRNFVNAIKLVCEQANRRCPARSQFACSHWRNLWLAWSQRSWQNHADQMSARYCATNKRHSSVAGLPCCSHALVNGLVTCPKITEFASSYSQFGTGVPRRIKWSVCQTSPRTTYRVTSTSWAQRLGDTQSVNFLRACNNAWGSRKPCSTIRNSWSSTNQQTE